MLKLVARFLMQTWCRVFYGHIMVKFGSDRAVDGTSRGWYMCARCLRCELIHDIPEEA